MSEMQVWLQETVDSIRSSSCVANLKFDYE